MNDDLPPDLPRLQTLPTWAAYYLTRIRTRNAADERQQAQPQLTSAPTTEPAQPCAVCRPDPAQPVRAPLSLFPFSQPLPPRQPR